MTSLAEESALAEHCHDQTVGTRHLHLPVADDVELVGGGTWDTAPYCIYYPLNICNMYYMRTHILYTGALADDEVGGHVDLSGDLTSVLE